ncbi:MAG TPA: glycosyltransferase family A protein [Bryobacteraceae bacterium]|nr:glycosyltransferase family A protein [Bryobacteraceae bacterium]
MIETANLEMAAHQRLIASLDSIARQSLSPTLARAVVLLDSGEAAPALLEMLRSRYPWISIQSIPSGTDYGDQKSMAVGFASGEIVVFADSDCVYESDWLRSFVQAFAMRPDIDVLAGETTVAITGSFTLAMALVFFFPRFSFETEVAQAHGFYGNNVAFRRDVFSLCPFPSGLPVHRGQNVVYSRSLHAAGIPIWRHPRARALHSPPEGMWQALRRFFWSGQDTPRIARLATPPPDAPFQGDCEPHHRDGRRIRKVTERVRAIYRQQPHMLLLLPVALPIALACTAAFFLGVAVERLKPSTEAGRTPSVRRPEVMDQRN